MDPGDTCMIIIKNDFQTKGSFAFWKIWKDDLGLQFYLAPSYLSNSDKDLQKITNPGAVESLALRQELNLFVINPTLKPRTFNLQYSLASVVLPTLLVAILALISFS